MTELVQLRSRRREGARKRTLSVKRANKGELLRLAALYPDVEGVERPRARRDCLSGGSNAERPCPFVSCRNHLAIDVTTTGSLIENFPDRELEQLLDSCALDVADRGGLTLEQTAERMNLTRERLRQLEILALERLPDELVVGLWEHAAP
jgi:hypothetical protein